MMLPVVLTLVLVSGLCSCDDTGDHGDHVWTQETKFQNKDLDQATLLLSGSENINNNPLDNLSDLRDIHQFDIDLTNYTDHEAVETGHTDHQHLNTFIDHFDILPGMDTRDFNDTEFYSSEVEEEPANHLQNLSPELYEVVTSLPEEHEAHPYDKNHLDNDHFHDGHDHEHDGMDGKYYTLLENIHKKFHDTHKDEDITEEEEIHDEDNDVMHPLISLTAIKPNSMRLAITPKKFSKDSMVYAFNLFFHLI